MNADWVVDDSEGEDMDVLGGDSILTSSTPGRAAQHSELDGSALLSHAQPSVFVISSCSVKQPALAADSSTISHFESVKSTRTNISTSSTSSPAATTKSRPRPRPAYKGKQAVTVTDSDPAKAPGHQSTTATTRADPTTTLSDPPVRSNVILPPPTSRSDPKPTDLYSQDLAERVKMRSRKMPASNASTEKQPTHTNPSLKPKKQFVVHNDVIDLASDSEDELALPSLKKSASVASSNKAAKRSRRAVTPLSSPLPGPSEPLLESHRSQNTIPILSTSPSMPASTLPPSDFPSTVPTEIIFSPQPQKRQSHQRKNIICDDDEDEQSPVARSTSITRNTSYVKGPTFFASSSSVPGAPEHEVLDGHISRVPSTSARTSPVKKAPAKRKRPDNGTRETGEDGSKTKKRSRKEKSDGLTTSAKSKGKKKAVSSGGDVGFVFVESVMIPPTTSAKEAPILMAGSSAVEEEVDAPATPVIDATGHLKFTIQSKGKKGKSKAGKKSRNMVVDSDEEDADFRPEPKSPGRDQHVHPSPKEPVPNFSDAPRVPSTNKSAISVKENVSLENRQPGTPLPQPLPKAPRRSFSVRPKSTPMSELIRRVNSQPGSPFASSTPSPHPLHKSSKSALSRIAPLHPNRKTPPPPPPRPPKPKERKTKKQLEMEERWEMELEESVEGWACLTDAEREAMRKAKREGGMGFAECED